MDAVLGQGYDKGTGTKGKSWGKGQGQKGGSWGKGKGAYYCHDDGWNNWTPQMLLKIVPALDPDWVFGPEEARSEESGLPPPDTGGDPEPLLPSPRGRGAERRHTH